MGRLTRLLLAGAVATQLLLASAATVFSFTGFGTSTADATYGHQMTFHVTLEGGAPDTVELLLRFPGAEATLVAPAVVHGEQADYTWNAAERYVTSNTRIGYRWRATEGGQVTLSSEQTLLYDDDRPGLDWQSAVIGQATVHWYGDSESTARRLGELSAGGATRAEQLLGHDMDGPVDIFIYDARDDFFGALGPGAREWFGAATFPQIRTIFMWLGAGSSDYLDTTIVHEVTHVVFGDATRNPLHQPAKWLNEGLATWSERRSADEQRAIVQAEADGRGLFSFDAITYDFPFGSRGSSLSYAMGTTMVDMLISTYGAESMARLAGAYRTGASDDEALQQATGVAANQLYADYYRAFGADEPKRVKPAPILPSDVRKPGDGAAASQPVQPRPSAAGGPAGGDSGTLGWVVLAVLVLVVAGGAATWWATQRVRQPGGEP
jgi:hypothetical protein